VLILEFEVDQKLEQRCGSLGRGAGAGEQPAGAGAQQAEEWEVVLAQGELLACDDQIADHPAERVPEKDQQVTHTHRQRTTPPSPTHTHTTRTTAQTLKERKTHLSRPALG